MAKPEDKGILWSEGNIQIYVATHSLRDGYLFHADGNGNFLHGSQASKKKLSGARAGWPDLVYILDSKYAGEPRTVYIELKNAKGRLSPAQELLHDRMKRLGCEVYVVKALDGPEAYRRIRAILTGGNK